MKIFTWAKAQLEVDRNRKLQEEACKKRAIELALIDCKEREACTKRS